MEEKQKFINMIKNSDPSGEYASMIVPFLESYQGPLDLNFQKLIIAVVGLIKKSDLHEEDLEYIRELEQIFSDFDYGLELLKKDYENYMAGGDMQLPASYKHKKD